MSRPKTFEQAVDAILAEVREVLIARQRKHGSQAIDEIGNSGVYHQIRNKAARLHAKINPDDTWRENPTDDCVDGIGYNAIELMRYRGWWGLPLEVEQPHLSLADVLEERARRWAEATAAMTGATDATRGKGNSTVGILRYGTGTIHVTPDPRVLIMHGGIIP